MHAARFLQSVAPALVRMFPKRSEDIRYLHPWEALADCTFSLNETDPFSEILKSWLDKKKKKVDSQGILDRKKKSPDYERLQGQITLLERERDQLIAKEIQKVERIEAQIKALEEKMDEQWTFGACKVSLPEGGIGVHRSFSASFTPTIGLLREFFETSIIAELRRKATLGNPPIFKEFTVSRRSASSGLSAIDDPPDEGVQQPASSCEI